MKILRSILKSDYNLRTEQDYPVKGIEFIDINPLIIDHKCFKEITNLFVKELKDLNIDYILAPEARGFLFASPVSNAINAGLIPVRKKGKLAPSTVECQFDYVKEYGKDTLELPKLVDGEYKNKRFYVIDDILATGNTYNAIKTEIEKLGGIVVGLGVVLNIIELNNYQDVFSIIDVNEEH